MNLQAARPLTSVLQRVAAPCASCTAVSVESIVMYVIDADELIESAVSAWLRHCRETGIVSDEPSAFIDGDLVTLSDIRGCILAQYQWTGSQLAQCELPAAAGRASAL